MKRVYERRSEREYNNKYHKWALANKILNVLRIRKGMNMVSPSQNPYYYNSDKKLIG